MSTTKNFNVFFDFPDNVKITNIAAICNPIGDASAAKTEPRNYKTNGDISVTITVTNDGSDNYYYVIVWVAAYMDSGGNTHVLNSANVQYLAVFSWDDTDIHIGPQSTVASVYAFAQRITSGGGQLASLAGSDDFQKVAYAMKNNFYYTEGGVSTVISSPPNDMQTNSYAVFNFLSGLLYYSLTDPSVLTNFLKCVNSISGVNAVSSLDAIIAVAQHPFDNVQGVYDLLLGKTEVYVPSFAKMRELGANPVPDQWTLTIKINDSGAKNFLISGTAYTVFDKDNKAWVTNNFRQGTPNSGGHCMVFNPDGSPADISPIMGGGILGPGFGVAVSPDGATIAIGNYGWGSKDYNPVNGSISVFSSDGAVLCPLNGFINGLCRVQGMCYDPDGNLWMASWGTQAPMEDPDGPHIYDTPPDYSAVVCYVGGDPDKFLVFNEFGDAPSEWHGTFGVVIDREGNCIVSNAGTSKKIASSVYKVKLSTNKDKLEYVADWPGDWDSGQDDQVAGFEELRQPQIDDDGYIYVGGITSCRVVKLDGNTLEKKDEFFDNIYGPWGITIDSAGKKFITGFGGRKQAENVGGIIVPEREFGITVVDADDTSWTNSKLMTLPSGGDEVKLANGQPLYGNQTLPDPDVADLPDEGAKVPEEIKVKKGNKMPPSYSPLMRTTSTAIDRAGNLWCANNWKPSLFADVWANTPNANPGGDGLVIFVGVAEPIRSV